MFIGTDLPGGTRPGAGGALGAALGAFGGLAVPRPPRAAIISLKCGVLFMPLYSTLRVPAFSEAKVIVGAHALPSFTALAKSINS